MLRFIPERLRSPRGPSEIASYDTPPIAKQSKSMIPSTAPETYYLIAFCEEAEFSGGELSGGFKASVAVEERAIHFFQYVSLEEVSNTPL